MAVFYRTLGEHIIVSGKTFAYKDAIKSLGGMFRPLDKIWMIPDSMDNREAVQRLCARVGGGILDEKIAAPASPEIATTVLYDTKPAPAAAPVIEGYSIAELMTKVSLALTETFPRAVWVIGEIQNLANRKGTLFFELADEKANASQTATMTVKVTLWNNTAQHLTQKHGANTLPGMLQDGMKVRLLCQVGLYKDRGQVTLTVVDLDTQFTKGVLALQRERLLAELRAKGLATKNKQLPLTRFPLRIGLISAEGSRAKSDFLDQLFSYQYPGEVIFYPAAMQGENTLTEVVRALQVLQQANVDLIVLTRGGGSAADLRWFDGKEVAYAIAACPVPIIAAIGHHDDTCVAEEIAYRREKTPTAAADFIVHTLRETKDFIQEISKRLGLMLDRWIERENREHQSRRERLIKLAQQVMQAQTLKLTQGYNQLYQLAQRAVFQQQQMLAARANHWHHALLQAWNIRDRQALQLHNQLEKVDPRPWMAAGWTQLVDENRQTIRLGAQISVHQQIHARLPDAFIRLRVEDIEDKTAKDSRP